MDGIIRHTVPRIGTILSFSTGIIPAVYAFVAKITFDAFNVSLEVTIDHSPDGRRVALETQVFVCKFKPPAHQPAHGTSNSPVLLSPQAQKRIGFIYLISRQIPSPQTSGVIR